MIIRSSTGNVVSEYEFCAAHPNTSFPEILTPEIVNKFGGAVVVETPTPSFNPATQYPVIDGVEQVDGQWRQKWVVKNFTADELAARKPPSVTQRLAAAGVSIDELKAALGL